MPLGLGLGIHKAGYVSDIPAAVRNAFAHWRADLGVTLSGSDADTWTDQNGGLVLQAETTARPAFTSGGLGSQDCFTFDDAASERFNTKSFGATITQPFSAFAVTQHDDATIASQQDYAFDGDGTSRVILGRSQTDPDPMTIWSGSAFVSWGSGASTTAHVTEGYYNGASSEIIVDNGTPVTGSPGTNSMTGITVGSNNAESGFFWSGTIAEIIITNSSPSAADRAAITTYLGARYGLF